MLFYLDDPAYDFFKIGCSPYIQSRTSIDQPTMSDSESLTSLRAFPGNLKKVQPVVEDRNKRKELKRMVKQNTGCSHSSIYSQITFICKRIAILHEEGKISSMDAMKLIFEGHEQLSHQALPRDVVAENIHKDLDKLEGGDRTRFGVIMANTNSSVHLRGRKEKSERKDLQEGKYSESYWADII